MHVVLTDYLLVFCKWHSRLKRGRNSITYFVSSVRPSSCRTDEIVDKARQFILDHRRIKMNDICNILGLPHRTSPPILSEYANEANNCITCSPRSMTTINNANFLSSRICNITPKRAEISFERWKQTIKTRDMLMREKETSFEDIVQIQALSQAVVDSIRKRDFQKCLKQTKGAGSGTQNPKETT